MSGFKDWETPPEIWRPLHREFRFTVDGAANADNALFNHHLSLEVDAPTVRFRRRDRVWCNPPFQNLNRWVEWGTRREAGVFVMLLPASVNSKWFHEHIWDADANAPLPGREVRYPDGRPIFWRAGKPEPTPRQECMVLITRAA